MRNKRVVVELFEPVRQDGFSRDDWSDVDQGPTDTSTVALGEPGGNDHKHGLTWEVVHANGLGSSPPHTPPIYIPILTHSHCITV